jgi:DNA mismatch repair protein MutL
MTHSEPLPTVEHKKLLQSQGANAPQNRIQLLSPEIIHRIAAGEIVDRPASVLKELIENSIDAKSTEIQVTLVEGGLNLIKVDDNGMGISESDLKVALQRHATSKIKKVEDLDQIFSLGFRGEALAAASSVSRLTIQSKTVDSSLAYEIQSVGGAGRSNPQVCSRAEVGTTLCVEDLFFNVPARLKFLKKPNSELAECVEVFKSLALSHPEVSFSIQWMDSLGEIKGHLAYRHSSPAQRFQEVSDLTSVNPWYDEYSDLGEGLIKLRIFVFPPPHVSHQQKGVRLSVNGRWVSDKRLPFAAREAFLGLIEVGAFPKIWVDVQVEPQKIDVNIHPQKKEIRWPSQYSLAGVVYKRIRELIVKNTPRIESPINSVPNYEPVSLLDTVLSTSSPQSASISEHSSFSTSPEFSASWSLTMPKAVAEAPPFDFRELKVVGEVGAAWLVCESVAGLVIIDQHAAHERVQFEKILKTNRFLRSAPLAIPFKLDLPLGLHGEARRVQQALLEMGFDFSENTDEKSLEIIAMPQSDRKLNWGQLFEKIFKNIEEGLDANFFLNEIRVQLASSLACHGSVRRGQRLSNDQIKELLIQMSEVAWGGFCPHGRPVWKLIRHSEIENFFHR